MDILSGENAEYNAQRMKSEMESGSNRNRRPRLPAPLFGRHSLDSPVTEEATQDTPVQVATVSAKVTEPEQDDCNTAEKVITLIHKLDGGLYGHTTSSQREFIRLSTAPPGAVGMMYTNPSYSLCLGVAVAFLAGYMMANGSQVGTEHRSFRGVDTTKSLIDNMMKFVSN